ncbi:MAG: rod shape-determining protein RodA [Sedimentisphaerales bacterium]|nr:rod shape-determining protein RodA [Sedimentisphaerales bacterium]
MFKQIWHGKLGGLRLVMLLAVFALVAVGLLCISASGRSFEFNKQLTWLGISLAVMLLVNHVHYKKIGQLSMLLFLFTNLLLLIVLVGKHFGLTSIVPEIGGSYRWITLGDSSLLRIQPSELAKLSFILTLAWYLRNKNCETFTQGIIKPFLLSAPPMLLILLEPNLGTFLLFIPILFMMIFLAGARPRHILAVVIIVLICSPMSLLVIQDYQKTRIIGLFKQNTSDADWLSGSGYQLHKSKMCIGSGGVLGQHDEGIFVKYPLLPERHNDFIFAMIGHQWGFIGCALVLFLYLLLLLGAVEISASQPDPFGKLVAMGIATLMLCQMFVNISMTIGLAPVTGTNLPFISYGGSSLVSNFISLGLLINIARHHDRTIGRYTL